jgi:hypothetical protein
MNFTAPIKTWSTATKLASRTHLLCACQMRYDGCALLGRLLADALGNAAWTKEPPIDLQSGKCWHAIGMYTLCQLVTRCLHAKCGCACPACDPSAIGHSHHARQMFGLHNDNRSTAQLPQCKDNLDARECVWPHRHMSSAVGWALLLWWHCTRKPGDSTRCARTDMHAQ